MRYLPIISLALLCLASHAAASSFKSLAYNHDLIEHPSPGAFSVCSQHGCERVDTAKLSPAEWDRVRGVFRPGAKNAAMEREQIARAIGLIEQLAGAKVGTNGDRAGNLAGLSAGGKQQDCVDESTNSMTYLTMLAGDGLLRFHTVDDTKTRGFIIFGWPHTTAVIRENGNDRRWAVDSWFRDNGSDADMVPINKWKSGWSPEGFAGF